MSILSIALENLSIVLCVLRQKCLIQIIIRVQQLLTIQTEHKHFEFGTQPKTVISKEYSTDWKEGMEPYYPVNNEKNQILYQKYRKKAQQQEKVFFGGRLGEYKYYDMDKVIASAMNGWEALHR